MATAKNGPSERRSSLQNSDVYYLKQRVQELEREVAGYKRRLDELRKAKNQTILKREREIIEVTTPFQRRNSENGSIKETKDKKDEKTNINNSSNEEIEKLKLAHAEEVRELKDRIASLEEQNGRTTDDTSCGHLEQIHQLACALEAVENERDARRIEVRQLEERLEQVLNELSVKEASLCQRQDELTRSLSATFNEKYRQWMSETESKILNLQNANSQLRALLEAHRPTGSDPTGQDKNH